MAAFGSAGLAREGRRRDRQLIQRDGESYDQPCERASWRPMRRSTSVGRSTAAEKSRSLGGGSLIPSGVDLPPIHAAGLTSPPATGVRPCSPPVTGVSTAPGTGNPRFDPSTVLAIDAAW